MAMKMPDPPPKMRSISAKIPLWQDEEVNSICKLNTISRSDLVRLAISEAIDRYCDERHKEYPELTGESVLARFELCPIIMSLRKARRPKEDTEKRRDGKGGVGAGIESSADRGAVVQVSLIGEAAPSSIEAIKPGGKIE